MDFDDLFLSSEFQTEPLPNLGYFILYEVAFENQSKEAIRHNLRKKSSWKMLLGLNFKRNSFVYFVLIDFDLVSCPNPNDSLISFYILPFSFIEKWPQI